jgi:Cupin domain
MTGEASPILPVNTALSCAPYLGLSEAICLSGYFRTRDDVMQEILTDGWWPMAWIDKPGSSYGDHYHLGAEALYLLDGGLDFTDLAANKTFHLRPGDKLVLPARVQHRVSSRAGATYLLSLSVLVPFDGHFIPVEPHP